VPSRLQHIDTVGAYTLNAQRSIKEGIIIDFKDGHFVTTGTDMQAYVSSELDEPQYSIIQAPTYVRSNSATGTTGTNPRPHRLSSLSVSEVAALTSDVPQLLRPGVWFLIPKPSEINPITLATIKPGIELVYGIDFFTSKHFIITQLPPAEYFTAGSIVVSIGEVLFESFDAYPSDSPRTKKTRKWTNAYSKRAQSLELFRRAAAEFCGLYVLQDNDVLLNSIQLSDGSVVYAFANAGVVVIDYAHEPLTAGSAYPIGHVICDKFEIRTAESHGESFITSTGALIDLSGIFGVPVQMPEDGQVPCSFYFADSLNRPHLRLHLNASIEHLSIIWAMQMTHERMHGTSLAGELGGGLEHIDTFPNDGTNKPEIDYAALLTGFYGNRLAMLVIDNVPESAKFELSRFIRENSPTGSIVLIADFDADPIVLPPEAESNISYESDYLYYASLPLTYE
jgi:hypothetical protein